jgi:hypothetical protein
MIEYQCELSALDICRSTAWREPNYRVLQLFVNDEFPLGSVIKVVLGAFLGGVDRGQA